MQIKSVRFRCIVGVTLVALVAWAGTLLFPATRRTPPDPSRWEPQLSPEQSTSVALERSDSIVAMPNGDIWVTGSSNSLTSTAQSLIRYRPETRQILTYTVPVEGSRGIPVRLFRSSDGTLWGLGFASVEPKEPVREWRAYTPEPPVWALSRYDVGLDQFLPVRDVDDALHCCTRGLGIAEGPGGIIWLVLETHAWQAGAIGPTQLIGYDPRRNKVIRLDERRALESVSVRDVENLAVGPDGQFWLLASYLPQSGGWIRKVVRYDPVSGNVTDYGAPSSPLGAGLAQGEYLYLDKPGTLWVGNSSWLDSLPGRDPVWTHVPCPEAFDYEYTVVHTFRECGGAFRIYESSDGSMWYSSWVGLVWADPRWYEWHRLFDFETAIVEDDQHALWVAGNHQIYRYALPH